MDESISTLEYEVREWQECRVYKTMKEESVNRQKQVKALREVMQ